LDHILHGRVRRCREDLLEALARELSVSVAFLSGESLSGAIWTRRRAREGAEQILVDENAYARSSRPPGYQLAARELARAVVAAWRRDLGKGVDGSADALRELNTLGDGFDDFAVVEAAVERLLAANRWRPALLQRDKGASATVDNRKASVADATAFAMHGARLMQVALQPWLDGKARVDYPALVAVMEFGLRLIPLPSSFGTINWGDT
jgi:hypothetical protein